MAERAGDNPRRTPADKERSRQLSRSVTGKEAARNVGRSGRPQGRPQDGNRGGTDRRPAQSGGGRTRQPQSQGRPGGQRPGRRPSQQSRRPAARPGRSRASLYTWGAVALVLVVVIVVVLISQTSSKTSTYYTSQRVPATVLNEVTHVPAAVYNKVGTGLTLSGAIDPPTVASGQKQLTHDGKPGMFGLFGEYCPYCAAERWAIITAFSRFGTWSGLLTMQSSPTDVDPKTQTFDFSKAKYTSPYFSATLLEMFGQDNKTGAHKIIRRPTKAQTAIVEKYDKSSATSSGTIPFQDYGNKVFFSGASYHPTVLQGLSRTTIAAGLRTPNSTVTKLIIGAANYISAAICSIDGGKPGTVCSGAGVQAAAKALKLTF
jgi:hypothetical protein